MWKAVLVSLLAVAPSSSSYTLQTYDFGNGSGSGASSNYNLRGSANGKSKTLSSSSYTLPAGIRNSTTVAVPAAPTLTNPDNSYDRLKIVLNVGSAASDTKYAIAISDDNFTTTKYVKSDQTIGTSFSVANYQTYSAWGGASGIWILGLATNTTYKVKIAALQGSATGSNFGPAAAATTGVPSVTFGVSTSLTSTPPFAASFTSLAAGTVVDANATITTTLTTNTEQGGKVLVRDQNAGLTSSTASYTINSATADLTSTNAGYGAQITSTSQASGGPMVALSPFNGSSNNVGGLTTSWQELASFAAPITTGTVTFGLKAKADTLVPTATNYADVLTISVSLVF